MRVLAGDIGGTNARLAVIDVDGAGARIGARKTVPVADHDGIAAPLKAFLDEQDVRPTLGCLGVAGKVVGRRIEGVNSTWVLDADALEAECGLERLHLINDFHAAARGVGLLRPDDLLALGGGAPAGNGRISVIGAGTGLGQAFVLPGEPPRVVGTEGGHRDFGPRTPLQDRLLAHLRAKFGRVSTERVLSGPGLAGIYGFLTEAEGLTRADSVEALAEAERPKQISDLALAGSDPTCTEALALFTRVYGAEASNAAVTVLAEGGVYLAGGIAPKLFRDAELAASFREHFEDKGRFRDWLEQVPVWVVLNGDLGLLGAAAECAASGP